MNQEPSSGPDAAFDLNELARLNSELKQLRESIRQKRLERDKAKREGKKVTVDLRQEALRIERFIEELDQLRDKLKSSALAKADREASDAEALRGLLLEMKNQLVTEQANLEKEDAMRDFRDQLKHEADELRTLQKQLTKDKEVLEKERQSLESLLAQVKEEHDSLKSASMRAHQDTSSESKRPEPPPDYRKEEVEDRRLDFLSDQLSVIKTELRDMREHFIDEQRAFDLKHRELEVRRGELIEERGKIEQERKALEVRIAEAQDELTERTIQKIRNELQSGRSELAEERGKIKQERKALEMKMAEARDELAERTIQNIRNELQSERTELSNLRESVRQIRAANVRERKVIERDKEAILRFQVRLERERQRIAQKAALLKLDEKHERAIGETLREAKHREAKRRKSHRAAGARLKEDGAAIEHLSQKAMKGEGVVLGVKLGTEDYGIDTARVREIIRMREITPVPRQPTYVEGVMNVRGAIIPVVNLKKRFGLPQDGSKHAHIVIVESAKGLVGMLVDSVSEVIRVPAEEIHPPPQVTRGIDGEYLRGICRLGENLMIYLDLEKVLEQAVPIDGVTVLRPPSPPERDLSQLDKDERKIMRAIPNAGRTKLSLGKRVGLSTVKLDKVISSLRSKGLIEVRRVGNTKLIRRSNS
jgi:purine-binding chemotaxis protein CheW